MLSRHPKLIPAAAESLIFPSPHLPSAWTLRRTALRRPAPPVVISVTVIESRRDESRREMFALAAKKPNFGRVVVMLDEFDS